MKCYFIMMKMTTCSTPCHASETSGPTREGHARRFKNNFYWVNSSGIQWILGKVNRNHVPRVINCSGRFLKPMPPIFDEMWPEFIISLNTAHIRLSYRFFVYRFIVGFIVLFHSGRFPNCISHFVRKYKGEFCEPNENRNATEQIQSNCILCMENILLLMLPPKSKYRQPARFQTSFIFLANRSVRTFRMEIIRFWSKLFRAF